VADMIFVVGQVKSAPKSKPPPAKPVFLAGKAVKPVVDSEEEDNSDGGPSLLKRLQKKDNAFELVCDGCAHLLMF
jgi:hypothetical protein